MKSTLALIAAFSMALLASCSSVQKTDNSGNEKPVYAPVCADEGTRSEGWMFQGRRLKFSNCSGQIAQCEMQGTRSEGWYAYRKTSSGSLERLGLIQFASCSHP